MKRESVVYLYEFSLNCLNYEGGFITNQKCAKSTPIREIHMSTNVRPTAWDYSYIVFEKKEMLSTPLRKSRERIITVSLPVVVEILDCICRAGRRTKLQYCSGKLREDWNSRGRKENSLLGSSNAFWMARPRLVRREKLLLESCGVEAKQRLFNCSERISWVYYSVVNEIREMLFRI